jgi:creatinine amidohydrolase/Fe(II)-dependent formamide hydrolase-like protein
MISNHPYMSSLSLSNLTTAEVGVNIKRSPCLIIPLGGMEPFGKFGSLGISSICADAIAGAISQKFDIAVAPVLQYGCTSSFKSFSGSIGMKPKTFCSLLNSLCKDSFFQGFDKVFIINSVENNKLALDLLAKRFNSLNDKVVSFSLQSDSIIRKYVSEHVAGIEYGRSEYMMLSMAAFLQPAFVRHFDEKIEMNLPVLSAYTTWSKRGRDPEKYRKLFSSGSASTIAHEYNAQFGNELFEFILKHIENLYSSFLTFKTTDASS